MSLIRRLFDTVTEIEMFIRNYGMEKAVKTYSLSKLIKEGFLVGIERTNLYKDDGISFISTVYDKNGKSLGQITTLMSAFYKQLNGFETSCLNGNIILSCQKQEDNEFPSRTYGVFSPNGEVLVPYGKYFVYQFLPDGVALMNGYGDESLNATKINMSGEVKKQSYFEIEEVFPTISVTERYFQTKTKNGEDVDVKIIALGRVDGKITSSNNTIYDD